MGGETTAGSQSSTSQSADTGSAGTGDGSATAETSATSGELGQPQTLSFGDRSDSDRTGVTRDTYVRESAPGENFGEAKNIEFNDEGSATVGLLAFGLTEIPPASKVTEATLRVFVQKGGVSVEFHEVLELWDEGDQDNLPGEANWTKRTPDDNWTSEGVGGGSRANEVAASMVEIPLGEDLVLDLPLDLVQKWVADPETNHGLVVLSMGGDGTFIASDHSGREEVEQRPELTVTYRAPL
jgi:hypothetical protein